ncbi:MAG: ABC transporter permease [Parvularculaceae bacterium]|nr:ABC transporter permease [Parvularculaceae bacterium]
MNELFSGMATLNKKLLRDLWRVKGQVLAIVLVIGAGIALLVMSRGMVASLDTTMRAYYARYQFADIFAPAKRAPNRILSDLRAIDGVSAAEGRIVGGGLVDLPDEAAPISAQFVSIDPDAARRINNVAIARGGMPSSVRGGEALVLEPFAAAHGLSPGDEIAVTMHGARRVFRIAGTANAPEFIYLIPPGDFAPDPARYAVFWVTRAEMEAAYDLDGAFNEAVLTLSHGVDERPVIAALDRLLAPYGATGAAARADQISNKYLMEEMKQFGVMDRVMTPLFLIVSAFLLNVVMTRLVQTERTQIGLLKSFGYSNATIAIHYLMFAFAIALLGTAVGWIGGLQLGRMITKVYQHYFHFPFLIFVPELRTVNAALMSSVLTAGFGGLIAVAAAARLTPATAMRPAPPPNYRRGGVVGAEMFRIDQPTRMFMRRIVRQPFRAGLTVIGIGAAMGLAVMMRFNQSAIDYMLDASFNVIDRSDILVTFAEPMSDATMYEFKNMEGVLYVEPMRSTPALFTHGGKERLAGITGLPDAPVLNRALDSDLREIETHGDGVLLAQQYAGILGIGVGDMLTIEVREGRRPTLEIPVAGFVEAMIGTPIYMKKEALDRALKEPDRISGVLLKIDPNESERIYARLKETPMVAGVSLRREAYRNFQKLLDEGPGTFRAIMTVVSIIIAVGVVYNNARIAFIERERDLATLRILGFTKIETGYVLLGELAALTIIALPIGSLIGFLLWTYVANGMSTDLYLIPTVVKAAGFGYAALVVIAAGIVAGGFVQRDINRFDLVPVLKSRE